MQNKKKVTALIKKYNSILTESMQSAVAEDLVNLIIVNGDDKDFELNDLIKKKQEFKEFVFREFLRITTSPVTKDLSKMEELKMSLKDYKRMGSGNL